MMIVHTESGSTYEFYGDYVRRINPTVGKRGDGEWQPLIMMYPKTPRVGEAMLLEMVSLARYGADDVGTPPELAGETTRHTTPVTLVDIS